MPQLIANRAISAHRWVVSLSRVLLIACALVLPPAASAQSVFINELHYDNTGADTGEMVEIAAPAATDLAGWTLVLYNGNGGGVYDTIGLSGIVSGQQNGFGTLPFVTTGLQNGSPDGLALVDPANVVVEFLSYEGSFAATDGPALGMTSTDIGVAEASSTPIGLSLQRVGTGDQGSDFTWTGPVAESFGLPNDGQTFSGVASDPVLNELVLNHAGADTAEFLEVHGDADTDYSGFSIITLEGDAASSPGTVEPCSFDVGTTDADGLWFTGFLNNQCENGSLTVLLVEGSSATTGDDLDIDDDGALDTMPWTRVVDCVAIDDGGVGDRAYCGVVLTPGFDGGGFTVGGASRIPNAFDSDSPSDWRRNDFDGEGLPGFVGDADFPEALNTPGLPNVAAAPPLVINEVHADPDTSDGDANHDGVVQSSQDEFVEIVNNDDVDADLSGYTLSDGVGVRHTFPSGTLVPAGCAVVVFGGGTPTGGFGGAFVQTASSGALGLNNGGDDVTLADPANTAVAMVSYGAEGGNNQSLTRDPDITGAFVQHLAAAGAAGRRYSPGTRVDGQIFDGCVTQPREIWEIQGSGLVSPFNGQEVELDGDVVSALAPDGFFIQSPPPGDGDPATSDGVFVFTDAAPSVAVGDLVDVTGVVQEFFGFTEVAGPVDVTVVGSAPPIVPLVLDAATPSPDPTALSCPLAGGSIEENNFECYEGMLVSVANGVVGGPSQSFGSDPIAEPQITANGVRAFREPGVELPGLGTPGIATFDGNPEVFELDPDRLGLPSIAVPAGSTFSAVGTIGFEFSDYELWPTQLTLNAAPLPVPVRSKASDELSVGSLNLFRLFDAVDDPGDPQPHCSSGFRDDAVVSAAEYDSRRLKLARYIVDVLRSPDVLAVEEAEKLGVLQDLAAEVAMLDPTAAYTAYLIEGNDCGTIDTGFLVRDTVTVDDVMQLGKSETLSVDGSPLHDRPPLLLSAHFSSGGVPQPFSVMAVHQRSLGGIEDPSDGARVRQKRLEQAQSVAQFVQTFQETLPSQPLVVVGDFNAYEFTDGYVDVVGQIKGSFDPSASLLSGPDLVDPDLVDQVLSLPAEDRYSFLFRGSAQVLDHALTSSSMTPLVTGFEYGRGNADAPLYLLDDASTPLRSSDHDGFVLFVRVDDDGIAAEDDRCPGTVVPESVPTVRLLPGHFALVDGDGTFERGRVFGPDDHGPFTLEDTAGCSCEQILERLHLGKGLSKFGCPLGIMLAWIHHVK